MSAVRSTKLRMYPTRAKKAALDAIFVEYARVVNAFIDSFWELPHLLSVRDLTIDRLRQVETPMSTRLLQNAAREACSMVSTARNQPNPTFRASGIFDIPDKVKPHHYGRRMVLSSCNATLETASDSKAFDHWLVIASIESICGIKKLRIPVKATRHYRRLHARGVRATSLVLHRDGYVQTTFDIPQEEPFKFKAVLGVDTGINTLGMTHSAVRFGPFIKERLARIDRCKRGSKGSERARRALKQYIDIAAKDLVYYAIHNRVGHIVMEDLKWITWGTRNHRQPSQRRGLRTRRSIGNWNVRYWSQRVRHACELNRIQFHDVSPWNTSRRCPSCGHTDAKNRDNERFLCLHCGFKANADVVGAGNIAHRFISGPYGAGCKALEVGPIHRFLRNE